ncbi:MAG: dihydropteroate synthase [Calditrichaeota bacterium]|nr:dihydropteroate synthase [Calditrichota bacterium]RQW06236.1 MAG: dihydropteroate synthase [Calditrichota bacterium]
MWRIDAPLLMGILNITPDSFSDGGLFLRPEEAIDHAREMQEAGADIIDIGAESTRPGAVPVGQEEEWQRLFPVLQELKRQLDIPVSVDTYKAEIARRALEEGADIINDISGLRRDEAMAETVARHHCPLILMHMQGTPRDMQENPSYENLMEEIHLFFQERIEFAGKSGIEQLIIDPGLGFGKRYGDNYELLRRLRELRVFGYPLMVGPSRKSFIGKALGADADQRLMGTAAAVVMAVANGASILRVHDVPEMKQTLRIVQKIRQGKNF